MAAGGASQDPCARPLTGPEPDCPRCPRLVAFRELQRAAHPDWHNAPVASFGAPDATLLILGLAPGLKGANRTGRPFTGDYAGDLLYATLLKTGLAVGDYQRDGRDGLRLQGARITNAVRCVPPQNKPLPAETVLCQPFLDDELRGLVHLRVVLALGSIAHQQLLRALGLKLSAYRFGHGNIHPLPNGLVLVDSYHCSRQNTSTGRLTAAMFEAVFSLLPPLLKPERATPST